MTPNGWPNSMRPLGVELEGLPHPDRCQRVVDMEAPGQAEPQLPRPTGRGDPDAEVTGVLLHRGYAQIGFRVGAVGPGAGSGGPRRPGELVEPAIVAVEHGMLAPALLRVVRGDRESIHEAALGRPVRLVRAVKLEV